MSCLFFCIAADPSFVNACNSFCPVRVRWCWLFPGTSRKLESSFVAINSRHIRLIVFGCYLKVLRQTIRRWSVPWPRRYHSQVKLNSVIPALFEFDFPADSLEPYNFFFERCMSLFLHLERKKWCFVRIVRGFKFVHSNYADPTVILGNQAGDTCTHDKPVDEFEKRTCFQYMVHNHRKVSRCTVFHSAHRTRTFLALDAADSIKSSLSTRMEEPSHSWQMYVHTVNSSRRSALNILSNDARHRYSISFFAMAKFTATEAFLPDGICSGSVSFYGQTLPRSFSRKITLKGDSSFN